MFCYSSLQNRNTTKLVDTKTCEFETQIFVTTSSFAEHLLSGVFTLGHMQVPELNPNYEHEGILVRINNSLIPIYN